MMSPIIVLAVSYIIGIILSDILNISPYNSLLLFTLSILITALQTILVKRNPERESRMIRMPELISLVSIILVFCSFGILLTALETKNLNNSMLRQAAEQAKYVTVEGTITSDAINTQRGIRFEMNVRKLSIRDSSYQMATYQINEKLRINLDVKYIESWYTGRSLKIRGRPSLPTAMGGFDYPRVLFHKGIVACMYPKINDVELLQSKPSIQNVLGSFRRHIKDVNSKHLSKDCAGLLNGIVLGDPALVSEPDQNAFRTAGLTHIVAASGMNIAILLGVFWPLLKWLRIKTWMQLIILICAVCLYTMLSGMSGSIMRACVMACLALIGWYIGRKPSMLSTIAGAALLILFADPFTIFDIGFQLSFAATIALVVAVPVFDSKMQEIPKSIQSALSVVLAAQLGVIPILSYYFGQISVISIVANLIVVPVAGYVLILGMIIMPIYLLIPLAGNLLFSILQLMLRFIENVATSVATIPGASFSIETIGTIEVIVWYVVIIITLIIVQRLSLNARLGHVIGFVLLLVSIGIWYQLLRTNEKVDVRIEYFDVGQGDSACIRTMNKKTLLIDVGPDGANMKNILDTHGIRKIDSMILTHAHEDHVGGINDLIEQMPVGTMIVSKSFKENKEGMRIIELMHKKGVKIRFVDKNDKIELMKNIIVNIVYAKTATSSSVSNNEDSVVCMLEYRKFKALFTGDAEEDIERDINLDIDVLKVGHHGSAKSCSTEFLKRSTPAVSIISVGQNNKYGHPVKSTMQRLRVIGSRILRTDEVGDITITSDGESFRVLTDM